MFVKTFKKDYTLQLLLLLIIPIILWIPAFINPPSVVKTRFDMPIYETIYNIFSDLKLLSTIIAFLLVMFQGLALNFIFSKHQLSPKTTFLPAFIYITILSSDYFSMTLNPILLLNIFTICIIYSFFRLYDKKDGLDEIFNTSFLISTGILIFSPSYLFLLLIFFGFIIYKAYKWRVWIINFLGFITPFIFLATYYFLTDQLLTKINIFAEKLIQIPNFYFSFKPIQIVFLIGILFFALIAISNVIQNQGDNNISYRKKTSILILFFFISLLPGLYALEYDLSAYLMAPALAFFFYLFFFTKRKLIYSNIIFTLLLLLILIKTYFILIF